MRRVSIIGPGRVGGALAVALGARGDAVIAVAGQAGSASTARFGELVPEAEERPLVDVARGADLVLVTTPDDRVEEVAATVAAADGVEEGQRWVHTSGGHGVDVLSLVAAAGGRVAACHPAMTFPDARRGAERLAGTTWAVSAADPDLGWARVLVVDLGGSPVTLAEGDRTLYHAGLTIGSNATTAVATLARDVLLGAGIADPAAFLLPLVTASAEGGAARGPDALTGPVRRGDAGTVAAHLAELRTTYPEAVDTYVELARLILSHALRAGLDPQQAAVVRDVLDQASP